MSDLGELATAAALVLDAQGDAVAARLLRACRLVLAVSDATWEVGARSVAAQTFGLLAPAAVFVEVQRDIYAFEAIRAALGSAVASPETALADLVLMLELPTSGQGWQSVYRYAPRDAGPTSRPEARSILGGAIALLDAQGSRAASQLLTRAEIETAPPGDGHMARYLVRLGPEDYLRVQKSKPLADSVFAALVAVAQVPGAYQTFDFAAAYAPPPSTETVAEKTLRAALARRGIGLIVLDRDDHEVQLLAFGGGHATEGGARAHALARINLVPGAPPVDAELRTPVRIRDPRSLDDSAAERLAESLFRLRST